MDEILHGSPVEVRSREGAQTEGVDCVRKGLFGSNLPWALQIRKGDHCCLYHYEVGTLFALWQAECDGGKNLVPKAWGGRFPFQVRVALVMPDIISLAKADVGEALLNLETGRFHNRFEDDAAEALLRAVSLLPKPDVTEFCFEFSRRSPQHPPSRGLSGPNKDTG